MPWLAALAGFFTSAFAAIAAFLANFWIMLTASTVVSWLVRGSVIVAVVLWVPLPSWLAGLPGLISSLPSGVVYMLDVCEFKAGLGIVVGAWVLRSLIRLAFRVLG